MILTLLSSIFFKFSYHWPMICSKLNVAILTRWVSRDCGCGGTYCLEEEREDLFFLVGNFWTWFLGVLALGGEFSMISTSGLSVFLLFSSCYSYLLDDLGLPRFILPYRGRDFLVGILYLWYLDLVCFSWMGDGKRSISRSSKFMWIICLKCVWIDSWIYTVNIFGGRKKPSNI